ncbi:MAG: hypothetical protein NT011_07300 [Kiritimatiellaeota bacterium]|nr:hypothetical protein [Kiritimatiellota bacterium]
MKKLRWLACLLVVGVVVITAVILVSCESSGDAATLTIDNRTSEWLKIYIDTQPQQDSSPYSIQMIGVTTNAHLVAWAGATVQGQVTVTLMSGQNLTLKIYEGLQNYSLE